jgi:hypothetical protein
MAPSIAPWWRREFMGMNSMRVTLSPGQEIQYIPLDTQQCKTRTAGTQTGLWIKQIDISQNWTICYHRGHSKQLKICVFLARSQNWERRLLASLYLSVCPSVRLSTWKTLVHTGRIFIKFYIWIFFESSCEKFKYIWNLTRITGNLQEVLSIFTIISRSNILKTRNISDKLEEKNKTQWPFSVKFFQKLCRLCANVEK